jgi:uncharacterized membrane protein
MLAGVLIRQFFVLRLKKKVVPSLIAIAVALLLGVGVLLAPKVIDKAAGSVTFADVKAVIDLRCVACHAAQPTFAGFSQPPKGVILETTDHVAIHAVKMAEVISNRYMPIGNLTHMTEAERALIANWFAQGATTK